MKPLDPKTGKMTSKFKPFHAAILASSKAFGAVTGLYENENGSEASEMEADNSENIVVEQKEIVGLKDKVQTLENIITQQALRMSAIESRMRG